MLETAWESRWLPNLKKTTVKTVQIKIALKQRCVVRKEFLSWMTVSNTVRAAEQDKQSRLYLENCILKKHRIAENTRNEVFCNDSYEV